jgi:hypothetical protein
MSDSSGRDRPPRSLFVPSMLVVIAVLLLIAIASRTSGEVEAAATPSPEATITIVGTLQETVEDECGRVSTAVQGANLSVKDQTETSSRPRQRARRTPSAHSQSMHSNIHSELASWRPTSCSRWLESISTRSSSRPASCHRRRSPLISSRQMALHGCSTSPIDGGRGCIQRPEGFSSVEIDPILERDCKRERTAPRL